MACISKRRSKWVIDYRDYTGKRRWITCDSKEMAEDELYKIKKDLRRDARPTLDRDIRLGDYAPVWLDKIGPTIKPRTLQSYEQNLRNHILPALGSVKIRVLEEGIIYDFLSRKLASGLAKNSCRIIHATLHRLLRSAIRDHLVDKNYSDDLARELKLHKTKRERQEKIKAFTKDQLSHFLKITADMDPRHYPLFLTLSRTGMRLGEGIGLKWQDIDFYSKVIYIQRGISGGRIETPKSGVGRKVHMSGQLADCLKSLKERREIEASYEGRGEIHPWVFCTDKGTWLDGSHVHKAFKRILKIAGLSMHFSSHCLRHTYATTLLNQGVSIKYVSEQLGHNSIELTVNTYGSWLPMPNTGAVDSLDDLPVDKVAKAATILPKTVAKSGSKNSKNEKECPQVIDFVGAGGRNRTSGQLITNQLLCP